MSPPQTICILGGGITGLSSAFYLSRRFPSARIILLDKQNRLGGWVLSERVQLPGDLGSVVLEGGPRTLRPNGKAILELVNLLHLEDKIVKVGRSAPAASVRYLYIPPSYGESAAGLQMMPSIWSPRTYPFLFEILSNVIWEPFRQSNRPENTSDESVNSFLVRRFGDTFASKFGSAMVHGIYAADSSQVSVKAAFPSLWSAEERGRGSVILGFFSSSSQEEENEPYGLGSTQDSMRGISVFSFKDGIETLTQSLESHLQNLPNVTIMKGTEVRSIEPSKNQSIKISHSSGEPIGATHVVSTCPLSVLGDLLHQTAPSIPHLRYNPSSNVCVLNLVFPYPPVEILPEGFGYLIPRPLTEYPSTSSASNAGILGVVFDSCFLHEQDTPPNPDYYHNGSATKVTVMLGGPYRLEPLPGRLVSSGEDDIPALIRRVLNEMNIHLSRILPDPVYWRIWNNEGCIPTMLPGHLERMEEIRAVLRESPEWNNRMAVIGAGVGGVSLSDCVEAARQVGRDWM